MNIYSRTKTRSDKIIEFVFRAFFGLIAAVFTVFLSIGLIARGRLSDEFAGQYMDSGESSVFEFLLSSPVYLILPIIVGVVAAIFPRRLWEFLGTKAYY